MAVVTTVAGGETAGCLVGFHAQCSIDPPRYAVWLSKANHTYRVALHAEAFVVHFLDASDLELARLFGTTTGDRVDKLSRCEWTAGPGGAPVLVGCPHHLVATKVTSLDDGGDHVCFVLAPVESASSRGLKPLRLSRTTDLVPGHQADERPQPASKRA